ncbi:MAG: phosphoribosylanthranilate isomerase [Candidatus Ratteibacteria bacterium]|nr:phosphoribosylanthranilate isomerase [Candidatus Ratteibacteria bacterium]
MTRIKICGITNLEDALLAASLGADAVGFIFAPSPRQINLAKARDIIKKIPPFISPVGVFVNEKLEKIRETADECPLDYIQLHGEEPPEFCRSLFPQKIIKTFRIKDEKSLERVSSYFQVRAILLDTFVEGQAGGTGKTFNWRLAEETKKIGRPIILSGGLSPQNVRQAIESAAPFAVDVSSGIESHPGKKDRVKLAAFIKAVREIPQNG